MRDFVLGCEVYQQEKSVHRLPACLLEPLTLPEQKWADVSMDFIIGKRTIQPQIRDFTAPHLQWTKQPPNRDFTAPTVDASKARKS